MTQTEIVRSRQPLTAEELRKCLIKIESGYGDNKKKSDYLPMQGRILWFHGENSRYTIETEPLTIDFNQEIEGEKWEGPSNARKKVPVVVKGVAVFKATVTIFSEQGEVIIKTSGTKMETKLDFPDYVEKSETGAIGRALALAGYGTKFALELHEGERLVDSPIALAETDGDQSQPINAPLPSELRAQAKELGKNFDSVVKFLFKRAIPDDELTPDDCKFIHATFEKSAAIRKQAATNGK